RIRSLAFPVARILRALPASGLGAPVESGHEKPFYHLDDKGFSDENTLDLRQCQPYPFHTFQGVK
ncbi:MAG TPA: hypothetical protein PLJ32_01635, partial [Kiritimatiellia bacterium]|nr:hypothetical protein [Kiritimatiellia bacterium]